MPKYAITVTAGNVQVGDRRFFHDGEHHGWVEDNVGGEYLPVGPIMASFLAIITSTGEGINDIIVRGKPDEEYSDVTL